MNVLCELASLKILVPISFPFTYFGGAITAGKGDEDSRGGLTALAAHTANWHPLLASPQEKNVDVVQAVLTVVPYLSECTFWNMFKESVSVRLLVGHRHVTKMK